MERNSRGQFVMGHTINLGRKKTGQFNHCLACNKLFYFHSSTQKGKYCSLECYWKDKKGQKLSNKHKEKIRIGNIGKHNFRHTDEAKRKIGLNSIGRMWTKESRRKNSESHKGSKCHFYKGGVSKLKRYKHYNNLDYKIWREDVFKRDNYTCQRCGIRSKKGTKVVLHPHHIKSYTYYPEIRYDIDNGLTLCVQCHRIEHSWKPTLRKKDISIQSIGQTHL